MPGFEGNLGEIIRILPYLLDVFRFSLVHSLLCVEFFYFLLIKIYCVCMGWHITQCILLMNSLHGVSIWNFQVYSL